MADLRRFMDSRTRTYDAETLLGARGHCYATAMPGKDAVNASATLGTDGYVDLGDGYTQGFACFDMATIASSPGTSLLVAASHVRILLQGGKDTSFTTYVPLGILDLGDTSLNGHLDASAVAHSNPSGGDDQVAATRYFVPFHNRYGDQLFRYIRMWIHPSTTLNSVYLSGFLTGLH